MTKYIEARLTQGPRGILLGVVLGGITLAGCDSGDTGAGKAPQAGAAAPVAAPATTNEKPGKSKGDTTSRRQHQKEQPGATK